MDSPFRTYDLLGALLLKAETYHALQIRSPQLEAIRIRCESLLHPTKMTRMRLETGIYMLSRSTFRDGDGNVVVVPPLLRRQSGGS